MQVARRDLRFGITGATLRARCWRVRSGARRPEVFLEREGLERLVHFSLHESGSWHLKVRGQALPYWKRPAEVHPGLTRAAVIVQPEAVATVTYPVHVDAHLARMAPHGDAAQFNVFLERAGANLTSWPGRSSRGTEFIGRIPLAAGAGTCCVVLHRASIGDRTLTLPRPPDDQLAELRRAMSDRDLGVTLFGAEPDGTMTIIDLLAAGCRGGCRLARCLTEPNGSFSGNVERGSQPGSSRHCGCKDYVVFRSVLR